MQILNTKLTDSRRYDGSDLSDKSEKITFLYTLNQNNLSKKPGFTGLFRTYAVLIKAVMNRMAKQKENRKQAEILRKVHPPGISAKENRHCHEFYTYIRIQRKSYTATNKQISHFQP